MRWIGALLSSVCLAAFVIGLSPHLVHHVTEDHRASDECPFAASAERAPAAAASIHVVAKPLPQPDGSTVSGQVALPRPARLAAGARAPPTASF
jgi:hypothetical protein